MHRLTLIPNLEDLRLEANAVALLTGNEDVRQELHLDTHFAFTLARFAASAGDVEREVTRGEAARTRILRQREQFANRIERLEVGYRIRSRRSPDRRLVHEHDISDVFEALQFPKRADPSVPVS